MNDMGSSISVALATYNGCPYLAAQLESMASQSRRPDEIVIGDDGSSDDTALVVERFAARHGIPTYWERNATRLGSSQNLARVIARCQGEIVAFADQDDVWMPGRLARLAAALAADPCADGAFSDGLLMDERGNPLSGTLFERVDFGAGQRAAFRANGALGVLVKRNVVVGATLAVRRATLLRLLPFEPGWVHDYYLALAVSVLGRLIVIDEPLIRYRRHSQQQIGIADARWQALVALARRQSAAQSQRESRDFERLRARLVALGVSPDLPLLELLSGKARFLARRAEMRARRSRAPWLIWKLLEEGGYQRYGAGWKQVLVDLVALGAKPAGRRR